MSPDESRPVKSIGGRAVSDGPAGAGHRRQGAFGSTRFGRRVFGFHGIEESVDSGARFALWWAPELRFSPLHTGQPNCSAVHSAVSSAASDSVRTPTT